MESGGFEQADVVFITDGECILPPDFIEWLQDKQALHGFSVTGILLDAESSMSFSLEAFCQQVYRTSELMGDEIARELIMSRV